MTQYTAGSHGQSRACPRNKQSAMQPSARAKAKLAKAKARASEAEDVLARVKAKLDRAKVKRDRAEERCEERREVGVDDTTKRKGAN